MQFKLAGLNVRIIAPPKTSSVLEAARRLLDAKKMKRTHDEVGKAIDSPSISFPAMHQQQQDILKVVKKMFDAKKSILYNN